MGKYHVGSQEAAGMTFNCDIYAWVLGSFRSAIFKKWANPIEGILAHSHIYIYIYKTMFNYNDMDVYTHDFFEM